MTQRDQVQNPVERAVRRSVRPGSVLKTPSQKAPFTVSVVDTDGVVLLLGQHESPTRLTWECLEGVPPFVRNHGGTIPIGGKHDVKGNPGTLDEHLKGCIKTNTAGYVAVMLQEAGVLEILHERPSLVRLAGE